MVKLTPQQAGLLGGRPPKPIDYPKLEALCKIQCTGEECAAVLGVDYDTLNRHLIADGHVGFAEYYKRHSEGGKASLRRLQWKNAEAGNVTMQIWLGKQYLQQTDKQEEQFSRQPINITIANPHGDN